MEKQKLEKPMLSEKELKEVNGGKIIRPLLEDVGMILQNTSRYSSGSEPKYHEGQILRIQYRLHDGRDVDCTCFVTAVSEKRDEGWLCPEFGYTVEIMEAPQEVLDIEPVLYKTYTRVYESCLYAR